VDTHLIRGNNDRNYMSDMDNCFWMFSDMGCRSQVK